MSVTNRKPSVDNIWKASPLAQVIAVLRQQWLDTNELQGRLDEVRTSLNGECEPRIRELLDGLVGELRTCNHLLVDCLKSLSADPELNPSVPAKNHSYLRSFRGHGIGCRGQLNSLLAGYAHYALTTADSITGIDSLGDEAAVAALNWILAATKKGLWFLEIYAEALALQLDFKRLPEWPHIGKADASPFN